MARGILFSSTGDPPLQPLADAALKLTDGPAERGIAYVPAATTRHDFLDVNRRAFERVGELRVVGATSDWQPDDDDRHTVEDASLIYLPGGNTYVLAERLARSGLRDVILRRLQSGTPLLTFSAGTVYCGPTILSTNDWNVTGSTWFDGLGLVPVHLSVHFPPHDTAPDLDREDRIDQLLALRGTRVLGLEEPTSLEVEDGRCTVRSGEAWLFSRSGEEPQRLGAGAEIR